MGFLRKDDISGTADLTNAVDNVFIVHRVNNDFKGDYLVRCSGGMKGMNCTDYSNVVEGLQEPWDITGNRRIFL